MGETREIVMSLKLLLLGFVAGFLATLIFHQGLWYLFNHTGIIPLDRPAWATNPIPPFGVPAILSKAFWGGLWGLVLAPVLVHLSGPSYWAAWILVGALALTAVAFFVVPPLKGEPMQAMGPRFLIGLAVNGAWGFGTALILQILGAVRSG
jgi:hypothetical protein